MTNNLENSYSNLSLEEEEENGLIIKDPLAFKIHEDFKWCLVRRFLWDLNINFEVMKNTLASI